MKDGEPCSHSGCLHHITYPYENCGRIGGKMMWTKEKPTKAGFYYWQNHELYEMSKNAVRVVQISKYEHRPGFHCVTLVFFGEPFIIGPGFNCDLGKEPPGWWCGPLPEPSKY